MTIIYLYRSLAAFGGVERIFIDKAKADDEIILIDASKLGEKRKEGKNQRTVLSSSEVKLIEDTFLNRDEIDDFSVLVTAKDIQGKKYSFSAGQYFEVKIEYVEITPEEFDNEIANRMRNLSKLFVEGNRLQSEIEEQLKEVRLNG